jgi:hypothetical protein
MTKTRIFILTYCKNIDSLFGNLLTFKTVRTGFKDAEIIVYDNNSIEEARKEIRNAAQSVGASYKQYDRDVLHHDFIRHQIESNRDDCRIIFLDTDLVFWDSFDDFKSDALMVGRKMHCFYDMITKTNTFERLHTSFLIINDTKKIVEKTKIMQHTYLDVLFYRPQIYMRNNEWYRFDTLGVLYNAIKDDCEIFTEKEMNKYDHLFNGTHLDYVTQNLPDHPIADFHKMAMEDINNVKGIWRIQEEYMLKHKVSI